MSNPQAAGFVQLMRLSPRNRRLLWVAVSIVVIYALLGFFAAPWLLKKVAVETVAEKTGAELRLSQVAINPFVLSLRVDGLELDDPQDQPFASVAEIFVNFQLSSLFRWAWTFDEFHIKAPNVNLARSSSGELNVSRFRSSSPDDMTPQPAPVRTTMPRIRVFNFNLSEATVHWQDRVPVDDVDTTLGPVNIQISDLNTLPQKPGSQTVVIQSEATGTLRWDGSLQFNPFQSAGHATVEGSHFPMLSAYIRYETGFDVIQGDADLQLDYEVMSHPDGHISAEIANLGVTFNDLLINTFSVSGSTDTDRQVLSLPQLQIAGGNFAWPQKSISISSLQIDDPIVSMHRDPAGSLNVVRTLPATRDDVSQPPAQETQGVADSNGEWSLLLQQFGANNLRFDIDDETVQPPAAVGLEAFHLDIRNIDNQQGTRFPTTLQFQVQSGGQATLQGGVTVLPELLFDFDLAIDDLALAGAHPYLATRADVQIDSGALAVAGNLARTADEPFAVTADVSITELLLTETDEGSRLGSWNTVLADNVVFSTAEQSLEISEIRMQQPYGDIRIAADGSVNLGRISRREEQVEDESPANQEVADEASRPFAVTVGRVIVEDAAADFADLSLPLPFSAEIAEMNGELGTIATGSSEPSSVSLEGTVDEFGLFRVTGVATPLAPAQNTDIKLAFQNVEMPKFSAYSIPFAGREIDSGKLDLDLGYKVTEGALVGENKIVLRDFELGETVPHPGAMSLPLGLAVALLKDSEGKIDIDLPVRGRVNDPEFTYGGVIMSALGNVLLKIVTSPFALLGKLVGAEADELETIVFQPGRADMTPPELEKAHKLAEALGLRPELFLEFSGVADRQVDGLALRTAKLQQLVESRIEAAAPNETDTVMYNDRQREVLQQLFRKQDKSTDPAEALQELRQQFISVTTGEDNVESESFDEPAYVAELRRRLIGAQSLADADFTALADERALNAQSAVLGVDQALLGRVRLAASSAVEGAADEPVEMKVTLTVDAQ